jgi:hypothetical protein
MGFVDDENVPVDAAQGRCVNADHLVGGEQHVEFERVAGADLKN